LESIFSKRKEIIKQAGIKKIKIMTKQYNLEVLL